MEINGAGYGTLGHVVYDNPSYRVVTGYPPHSQGDFVYLTYLVVNKSNDIVENFYNILKVAMENSDRMHELLVAPPEPQLAEIEAPPAQAKFKFNS